MCKVNFNVHVGCGKLLVVRPESISLPHRVDRALSFFFSGWNWDSPTPSPAGECAPPLVTGGGRGTLACGRGGGGSQFRRGDIHCGYSIVCTLWSDPTRRAFSLRNDACGLWRSGRGGGVLL